MNNKLFLIKIGAVVLGLVLIAYADSRGNENRIERQSVVEVASTTDILTHLDNTEGEDPVQCPGPGIVIDAHNQGTLVALWHGKTAEGEIDKQNATQSAVAYSFTKNDNDGCHFVLKKQGRKKQVTNFYCLSTNNDDTSQFFADWKSGSFFDNMMAYCNPTQSGDSSYPWECNYQTGIHCDVDPAL